MESAAEPGLSWLRILAFVSWRVSAESNADERSTEKGKLPILHAAREPHSHDAPGDGRALNIADCIQYRARTAITQRSEKVARLRLC